jgi:aspartyl-tRNA(Asn)/glutamyl-tRNA(Gln) amidotransferase subunit C
MANLSKKDVEHVANLAKLPLTSKEVETYLKQLDEVVSYIGELGEVDTEGVEPTSQTTGLTDVFREDEPKSSESLSQEEALAGSEKTHNGYFKVGAILTERTDK